MKRKSAFLRCTPATMACLFASFVLGLASTPLIGQDLVAVVSEAKTKVVKIYGAGGFKGLEAYQTGICISAEGHILTAWSHVLDSDSVAVVFDDGRRFEAKFVGHDPRIEIAILKVDGDLLPHFDLEEIPKVMPGDPVLALTNLYGVATGNEPVSIQHGTITAITPLDGDRTGGRLPFQGSVFVIDAMTSNPGAPGGALVNLDGQLIGMVGKDLKREDLNIWMNYAMPAEAMLPSIDDIRSGKLVAGQVTDGRTPPGEPMTLGLLGFSLVPDVLGKTPPFIDRVVPSTPAAEAGLLADDLILFVNDKLVASCEHVTGELGWIHRDDPVTLTVQRGRDTVTVELQVGF